MKLHSYASYRIMMDYGTVLDSSVNYRITACCCCTLQSYGMLSLCIAGSRNVVTVHFWVKDCCHCTLHGYGMLSLYIAEIRHAVTVHCRDHGMLSLYIAGIRHDAAGTVQGAA